MSLWPGASDRVNPLVILEMQRGLRARTFSAAFVSLLIASALTALVAYASYDGRTGQVGLRSFFAIYLGLSAVSFFVLPYGAFRSLSREREEHTWPLLALTRLGPGRILSGKIASAQLQAVLYASALAPFLLFSYLLQGIDLLTVAVIAAMSVVFQAFLTVTATAAATLAESRLWRGVVHLAVLGGLASATVLALSAAGFILDESHRRGISESTWHSLAALVGLMVSYAAVFFAVAVSRLTFESGNGALWPRAALLAQLALACAVSPLVWWGHGHIGSGDWTALAVIAALHASAAALFGATGKPGLSKRLREERRRSGLGLFSPGAANSLRFHLLLLAAFGALAAGGLRAIGATSSHRLVAASAFFFAVLYLCTPLALGRGPLRRWVGAPGALRAFVLFFDAAAFGLPMLSAVIAGRSVDDAAFNLLNPGVVLARLLRDPSAEYLLVLGPLALASALVAHQVAAARDREAGDG